MEDKKPLKPITNCHTHIFTGKHVPSFLAKTFIPWPLYYLLPVSLILWLFKTYRAIEDRIRYSAFAKWWRSVRYRIATILRRNFVLNILRLLFGLWITLQVLFILYDWISAFSAPDPEATIVIYLNSARTWLEEWNLLLSITNFGLQALFVLFLLLFVKSGRNLIFFLFKKIWAFFGMLPGKMTKDLLKRYLLLGRYTLYKEQSRIYSRLRDQYPPGSRFVILPMDMKYMGAGSINSNYRDQMEDLVAIKNKFENQDTFFPFVFADPRRIKEQEDFFKYSYKDGRVQLEDCDIKKYIETYQFSGFKIYPALGYFPFDEQLLALWKYAADRGLPVLTHCIRGTIFYRGKKEAKWDRHPVFEQVSSKANIYEPLLLPELKNIDFSINFSHPLNYLCLLEEQLLRKLVANAQDDRIRNLFGYNGPDREMDHNLKHLKICLGHFGGEDQWQRFLESDRYALNNHIIKFKDKGIDFLNKSEGTPAPGKPEQVWKNVDWYSIICSLMLQFPKVYADISYILHDEMIFPLLKQTLLKENPVLRQRVLFGTDFYVVRNHKSDKNLLPHTLSLLDEEEFNLIARENPAKFLHSNP